MWPTFTILLILAAVALHGWWRRRFQRAQQDFERKAAALKTDLDDRIAFLNAQQEALFNGMVEGLLILNHEGRIQWANRAVQRLFGVNDLRGRTIIEAFRLHELAALVQSVREQKQVLGYELKLPGSGGPALEINATAIIGPKGEPEGVILVFHDLTRLRELENTRQEFVANVSHELRTPLSLIQGFVETLLGGAKDDPEIAARFLGKIQTHTARLTFLIEDLLTISRLESGRMQLKLERIDPHAAAERVREDLGARAAEKSATIKNEIPAGLWVQADLQRLQQVLFNLVDNAIKYGRAGGMITVGGGARDGSEIELWVQDDGPGIPPEATERIFERFYRLDKARSREQGGTGLGLSIVKHIVQSHGGTVRVNSRPGQGTAFFVTLPKALA